MGPGFESNHQQGLNFGGQPSFQGQPQQAYGGPTNIQFAPDFASQHAQFDHNAFQPGWNQAGFVNQTPILAQQIQVIIIISRFYSLTHCSSATIKVRLSNPFSLSAGSVAETDKRHAAAWRRLVSNPGSPGYEAAALPSVLSRRIFCLRQCFPSF